MDQKGKYLEYMALICSSTISQKPLSLAIKASRDQIRWHLMSKIKEEEDRNQAKEKMLARQNMNLCAKIQQNIEALLLTLQT